MIYRYKKLVIGALLLVAASCGQADPGPQPPPAAAQPTLAIEAPAAPSVLATQAPAATQPAPQATEGATSMPIAQCQVIAEGVVLRAGPGEVYEVVLTVPRGAALTPIAKDEQATWFVVVTEGATAQGWMPIDGNALVCTSDLASIAAGLLAEAAPPPPAAVLPPAPPEPAATVPAPPTEEPLRPTALPVVRTYVAPPTETSAPPTLPAPPTEIEEPPTATLTEIPASYPGPPTEEPPVPTEKPEPSPDCFPPLCRGPQKP
jgi:hypothetical protein